jgi:dihydrolipoamide dehydrogenase
VEAIPADDKLVGYAQFADDTTLVVGDVSVKTGATVIATGSTTSYPPAWNALGDRLITNETVFEWPALPASVAVFGPGVIGLELGQALHRLGVRVKVFGRGGGVGPLSDPELVTEARRVFGSEFYLDTDAHAEVSLDDGKVAVRYRALDGETQTEHFDYLLAATGRAPNVGRLGLERTSVVRNAYGVPAFDRDTLQCGSLPIFIAGDANADVPLLHEAADEGRIAGDNAARFPDVHAGVRRSPLSVVFTDPQIAVIGSGWRGARDVAHVTGRVSFDDQGRARVMQRNRGRLHVYAEIGTGLLLGAEMIGPDAEHLGHLLAWSHQLGLTIGEMLKLPFYHPVVEEGLRTALRDAYAQLDAAAHALRAA